MGLLLLEGDFSGKFELAKSNDDLIDEYIAEYEERTLIELLGKELFDLFKAEVTDQVVAAGIYKTIYDPFVLQVNGYTVTSQGMKKMLLGLLYFQYVRDNRVKQTMNGAVEQQTEVAVNSDNTFLYLRYNDGVDTYKAIQQYILSKLDVYPTFLGLYKMKASFV